MAVSVQAPFYSKSGMWNLGDPPTTFSSSGPEGLPASMSYQYPLSAPGLDSSSNMIPSFHHPSSLDHAPTPPPPQTKLDSPSLKTRVNPAGSKAAKVKRSMSTPNVRGQATADAAALALSAEKRRNKLGYHRTSVACGHCRRRKIRCIPAPGDAQSRCSNCIRLKKECNFYPVDQAPPPDPRRRGSKTQSGPERTSESSSPSTGSGQLPEMQPTLPYPPLNMPPIQDLVVTSSRNFEYNTAPHHGATNWMAPDASPGAKPQTEVPQPYWRVNQQESPLTPAFSPFTPSLQIPPPQNWPASHPEPSPREDIGWSVPQRSISYSNLEGLHNHQQYSPYPNPPPQAGPDQYAAKPRVLHSSGMYPPPIQTSGAPVPPYEAASATSSDTPQHPHSAQSLPPVPISNWQQPYSYQKPASAGPEYHEGWSAGHGGQPHLQPGTQAPPSGYGYPDPGPGMYYPPPHQGR
ncbi:hypothetical protein EG329_010722 [Mollisiaceae sp. DMI_Dod_QoI]|nr:hypothetical protein EG329_010722 [Helotiales sp. DMI_Dod_QoI]